MNTKLLLGLAAVGAIAAVIFVRLKPRHMDMTPPAPPQASIPKPPKKGGGTTFGLKDEVIDDAISVSDRLLDLFSRRQSTADRG